MIPAALSLLPGSTTPAAPAADGAKAQSTAFSVAMDAALSSAGPPAAAAPQAGDNSGFGPVARQVPGSAPANPLLTAALITAADAPTTPCQTEGEAPAGETGEPAGAEDALPPSARAQVLFPVAPEADVSLKPVRLLSRDPAAAGKGLPAKRLEESLPASADPTDILPAGAVAALPGAQPGFPVSAGLVRDASGTSDNSAEIFEGGDQDASRDPEADPDPLLAQDLPLPVHPGAEGAVVPTALTPREDAAAAQAAPAQGDTPAAGAPAKTDSPAAARAPQHGESAGVGVPDFGSAPAAAARAPVDGAQFAEAVGRVDAAAPVAAAQPPLASPQAASLGSAQPPASAAPASVAHVHPQIHAQPGRIGHEMGVEIARATKAGTDELRVRLNPVEMGAIEVKLSFDERGTVRAVVAAESAAALDMLRRDSADLNRALADAGIRSDAQSFRFDTRAGSGGEGGRFWQRQQQAGDQNGRGYSSTSLASEDPVYRPLRTSGQVDLMA